jgi:hypothetical protein
VFQSFHEGKILQFCFKEVMFNSLAFNTLLCCLIVVMLYLVVVLACCVLNLA